MGHSYIKIFCVYFGNRAFHSIFEGAAYGLLLQCDIKLHGIGNRVCADRLDMLGNRALDLCSSLLSRNNPLYFILLSYNDGLF